MKKIFFLFTLLPLFALSQPGVTTPGNNAPRYSFNNNLFIWYGGAFHRVTSIDSLRILFAPSTNIVLSALASQANNTIVGNNSGGSASPTTLTAAQVSALIATATPQLITGTPTIVAGIGAGTSPTVSVTTNGKQLLVTVITGTLPTGTNATIATVTLPNALSYTPYPVFSSPPGAATLLSAASMIGMSCSSGSSLTLTSGTTALTAATTYVWNVSL